MLFNSFSYVLLLFTAYVLYWTLREKRPLRHGMLLVISYWFYGQAGWWPTLLLAWTTLIDWWVALRVQEARDRGDPVAAKRWLWTSMGSNLAVLAVFKYYDFFVTNVASALAEAGVHVSPPLLAVALPVGISFYTFGSMSYVIDVWRGTMPATKSLLDFATFVAFFPHLVAGPIVRGAVLIPQLQRLPRFRVEQLQSGLFLFLRGLAKKLLMADVLGSHLVDRAFADADSLAALDGPGLLLATYAYALQLYGDFSGYSDMAIGSARVLGCELLKNFDAPFKSRSLEEFWSRWHISMSTWFTDYVYVGMGGSRKGLFRTCLNALFTWTLVGLWHGAAWTFVLWGFYHGLWLVISRLVRQLLPGGKFPASPLFAVLGVLFTFHVVAFSMVLFRCEDMASFAAACQALTEWGGPLPSLSWQVGLVIVLGYVTHFLPTGFDVALLRGWGRVPAPAQGLLLAVALLLFFALRPPGLTPFVYYNF